MLTAKQYEGIGRFTIAFNEIDLIVTTYLPLVVKYSNYKTLQSQKTLSTFHARSNALRKVLNAVSTADLVAGAYAQNVLNFLDMADAVSQKRNGYVHAIASIDIATNARILQIRGKDEVPDEEKIFNLANESGFVSWKLAEECESLLRFYLGMSEPIQNIELSETSDEGEEYGNS